MFEDSPAETSRNSARRIAPGSFPRPSGSRRPTAAQPRLARRPEEIARVFAKATLRCSTSLHFASPAPFRLPAFHFNGSTPT